VLDERLAASPRARHALAELSERPLNFDPAELEDATEAGGWHIDDYRQPLPAEPPGAPVESGTFERARALMSDYAFADPAIVRAVFDPASGLANRNMLLQVRFGPLRLYFGCRVGSITDEQRSEDGRPLRVWGWSYGTLAGHVERGRMDWEVCKWLDDGSVEFRIHVVSRRARVRNPIIRLGFRLFGRSRQVRFARRACERMAQLVGAGSGSGSAGADEASAAQLGAQGLAAGEQRRARDGDERHAALAHPEQQLP
jgi:uncharacterized protein (UPF0548 family)